MKRFWTGLAAAGALWAAMSLAAQAAPLFEPGTEYKTLETQHFRIYYTAEFEQKAKQVAAIAEDTHAKLTPYMRVEPNGFTEVVITDGYDELNSMAHNSPHRAVWLWMTPPNPDEGMPIGRYDLWLRLLFTHEYTHILQFEQTPWIWNQVNTAAGGLLLSGFPQLPIEITLNLPDLLSNPPAFVLEGHAVHTETHFTGGGREVEGEFDMERRMAVLAGREPTFDQIVGRFLLDWPVAGYEYTWGNAYMEHVTRHYGEDAPIQVFKQYGAFPYRGYDDATFSVLKKGTQQVWEDMMAELRTRYAKEQADWKARVAKSGLPTPKEITTTGRYHRHPVWKPDGTLLYGEALKNKGPKLMATKLDGKEPTPVMGKSTRSAIAYNAKDDKYVYETDTSDTPKGLTSFRDLFEYDPKAKKAHRLTRGARTYAPAMSPDGERIVTTTSGGGKAGVAIFDKTGKQLQKWAFDNNDYQFGNPIWSPDGKQLVIAVWHGGTRDIWLLDPATSEWRQLWADNAVDLYPQFSPDGSKIVFTSDRTNTFQLYAYDLATHALRQLTDVLGGAFDPAVSPDGKTLAFANYTGRGYDINTIPFEPDAAPVVATLDPPGEAKGAMPLPPAPEFKAFYPYNPLYTLQPSVWFPVFGEDEWGTNLSLYSFWQDVLRMHTLTLIGGYGFYSQRLNYGVRYENDTGPLNWSVGLNEYPQPGRVPLNGKDSNGDQRWADLWQWNKSASLSFEYPGLRNPMFDPPPIEGQNWTFGVQTEQYNDYALKADLDPNAAPGTKPDMVGVTTHPGVPTAHDNGAAHSLFVQWQNADQVRYPYDYGPMSGQITTLGAEAGVTVPDADSASSVTAPLNIAGLPAGTAAFTRLWADHRFYKEIPWLPKHSLAVRGTAGLVYNRNGEFYYGIWRAPFGYQPLSTINRWDLTTTTDYSNRSLLMRGYSFVLGNRDLTLSTEYRLPIWEVEHGKGDFPVFLNRVYGVGFVDAGYIWGLDSTAFTAPDWTADFKAGVGAELRAQTSMFQAVPIDIRLGVARGLTSDGVFQLNWGLGTTF